MKKYILTIGSIIIMICPTFSQDFKEVLKSTLTSFEKDTTFNGKLAANNKLALIADKWNDQWIAHYYAAYGNTILSFMAKGDDKKDAYLDEADKQLASAKELLKEENDEWYVLSALVANARISVKPMSRYQKYGQIFDGNLAKAKSLRPDNPRINYLEGMKFVHTPKMFGGGEQVALPYFQKASDLYKNESSDDILKPSWGKAANETMLAQCKEAVAKENM